MISIDYDNLTNKYTANRDSAKQDSYKQPLLFLNVQHVCITIGEEKTMF